MDVSKSFAIWLIELMLIQFGTCSSSAIGTVFVKFDSYRQQNPDSCDRNWFGSDQCDPYFIISVSTQETILGTLSSTEYDNAPRILHFGSRIGQLPNPLAFDFTGSNLKPIDNIQVSVTVNDKDPGGNDYMCNFYQTLSTIQVTLFANGTVNSSWSAQPTQISSSRKGHTLNMAVWITCRPNYYQAGCSVHCDPSRFGCSSTGSVICPAGQVARNGSCAPLEKCQQQGASFCLNGGGCAEDLQGQPVCQCPMNFTGPRCQLETHPCHHNATWCSEGTCQTFNSNGTSVCVCDKGFTGYHCDQDVDECRLVASLCGSNGDCVNSVGSFRCICRDGFSGALCQFQQTTPSVESTMIRVTGKTANGAISPSKIPKPTTPVTRSDSIPQRIAPVRPTQRMSSNGPTIFSTLRTLSTSKTLAEKESLSSISSISNASKSAFKKEAMTGTTKVLRDTETESPTSISKIKLAAKTSDTFDQSKTTSDGATLAEKAVTKTVISSTDHPAAEAALTVAPEAVTITSTATALSTSTIASSTIPPRATTEDSATASKATTADSATASKVTTADSNTSSKATTAGSTTSSKATTADSTPVSKATTTDSATASKATTADSTTFSKATTTDSATATKATTEASTTTHTAATSTTSSTTTPLTTTNAASTANHFTTTMVSITRVPTTVSSAKLSSSESNDGIATPVSSTTRATESSQATATSKHSKPTPSVKATSTMNSQVSANNDVPEADQTTKVPKWKVRISALNLKTVSLALMGIIILVLCIMVAVVLSFVVYLNRSTARYPHVRTLDYPLDDRQQHIQPTPESLELHYGVPAATHGSFAAPRRQSETIINSAYEAPPPRVLSNQWQQTQSFSWHQA